MPHDAHRILRSRPLWRVLVVSYWAVGICGAEDGTNSAARRGTDGALCIATCILFSGKDASRRRVDTGRKRGRSTISGELVNFRSNSRGLSMLLAKGRRYPGPQFSSSVHPLDATKTRNSLIRPLLLFSTKGRLLLASTKTTVFGRANS